MLCHSCFYAPFYNGVFLRYILVMPSPAFTFSPAYMWFVLYLTPNTHSVIHSVDATFNHSNIKQTIWCLQHPYVYINVRQNKQWELQLLCAHHNVCFVCVSVLSINPFTCNQIMDTIFNVVCKLILHFQNHVFALFLSTSASKILGLSLLFTIFEF